MDRELKTGVKRIERGVELHDEEQMRGRQMAGTLESGELLADLEDRVSTLRQKVRSARVRAAVVYALAAVVLVVRLIVWR